MVHEFSDFESWLGQHKHVAAKLALAERTLERWARGRDKKLAAAARRLLKRLTEVE